MKKLYILLFALLIASTSFGQVIGAEDFAYADGSLVPNGGWANHSGTLGDLLVESGQAVVEHGTPSEDANIAFAAVSGNIYYAFDFSVDDLGTPVSGTDAEYFASFRTGFDLRGKVDIVPPSGAGDFSIGIGSISSDTDAVWATDLNFETIYRAVVRYDQDANIAELWIDASASTDTSILGVDETDPGDSMTSFALRQSDSADNETIRVDDLMIGQTFNDVLVFVASTNPLFVTEILSVHLLCRPWVLDSRASSIQRFRDS